MRPLGLRGKFFSRTAYLCYSGVPLCWGASCRHKFLSFFLFRDSSTWSHSQAEQTPHNSRAPLSTIQTCCTCARNLDNQLSWVSRFADFGTVIGAAGGLEEEQVYADIIPDTA